MIRALSVVGVAFLSATSALAQPVFSTHGGIRAPGPTPSWSIDEAGNGNLKTLSPTTTIDGTPLESILGEASGAMASVQRGANGGVAGLDATGEIYAPVRLSQSGNTMLSLDTGGNITSTSGRLSIGNISPGGRHPAITPMECPPSGQAPIYNAVVCEATTSMGVMQSFGNYKGAGEYAHTQSFDVVPDATNTAAFVAGYGNDQVGYYLGVSNGPINGGQAKNNVTLAVSTAAAAGTTQLTLSNVTYPVELYLTGTNVTGLGLATGTTITAVSWNTSGATADAATQLGVATVTLSTATTAAIPAGTTLNDAFVTPLDVWARNTTITASPGTIGAITGEELDANNFECDSCGGHAFYGHWLTGSGWYPMMDAIYITGAGNASSQYEWHIGVQCENHVEDTCFEADSTDPKYPTYDAFRAKGTFHDDGLNLSGIVVGDAAINVPPMIRAIVFDGGGAGSHALGYTTSSGLQFTNSGTSLLSLTDDGNVSAKAFVATSAASSPLWYADEIVPRTEGSAIATGSMTAASGVYTASGLSATTAVSAPTTYTDIITSKTTGNPIEAASPIRMFATTEAALPVCNASFFTSEVFVTDGLKPGESSGNGSGIIAICANASKGGKVAWLRTTDYTNVARAFSHLDESLGIPAGLIF